MASAVVTDSGIVVTFGGDEVSVPGSPTDQDEAGIERAFAEAVTALGVTAEHVDAVTNAHAWHQDARGDLVQLFRWKPDVNPTNWRDASGVRS